MSEFSDKNPEYFYHKVSESDLKNMDVLRTKYIMLGRFIDRHLPNGRSKSIAKTHLEESLMRAIQSLALQGEIQSG